MFVELTTDVSHLRLTGPAGLVAAVGLDFGRELVAQGNAVELTMAEFFERLTNPGFTLANDPPKPVAIHMAIEAHTQRPLFDGMNCLPGQLDLFAEQSR